MNYLPIPAILLVLILWSGCEGHLSPSEAHREANATESHSSTNEEVIESHSSTNQQRDSVKGINEERDTVKSVPLSVLQSDILTYLTKHPGNPKIQFLYSGDIQHWSRRSSYDRNGTNSEDVKTSVSYSSIGLQFFKSDHMRVEGNKLTFYYSYSYTPRSRCLELYLDGLRIDSLYGSDYYSDSKGGNTQYNTTSNTEMVMKNLRVSRLDTGFRLVITGEEINQHLQKALTSHISTSYDAAMRSGTYSGSINTALPATKDSRLEIIIK